MREWTEAERQGKRKLARRLHCARCLQTGYYDPWWIDKEKRLLGKLPHDEVARRTRRTVGAVRAKRVELGLPNPQTRAWTAEEIALLATAPDGKVAERIGRTRSAVSAQRWKLGIAPARERRDC